MIIKQFLVPYRLQVGKSLTKKAYDLLNSKNAQVARELGAALIELPCTPPQQQVQ
jgi:hypothetical protein